MPISPELLKIMKERMQGTMIELIGFLPVEVSKERVVAELHSDYHYDDFNCSVIKKFY